MLRTKGLTDKVLLLGIDGMDPRFSKKMVDQGKMPNLKKMIELGSAREDLMLLGGMPTITPPMWTTHGDSLSTATGHNDTSVSPIFAAVGPGVKKGFQIKNYVREVDVAPTAAVLLGVDIPKDCEGAPAYSN